MFCVLEGTGEVRIGEERFRIRAGDVIACPTVGGKIAGFADSRRFVMRGDQQVGYWEGE